MLVFETTQYDISIPQDLSLVHRNIISQYLNFFLSTSIWCYNISIFVFDLPQYNISIIHFSLDHSNIIFQHYIISIWSNQYDVPKYQYAPLSELNLISQCFNICPWTTPIGSLNIYLLDSPIWYLNASRFVFVTLLYNVPIPQYFSLIHLNLI